MTAEKFAFEALCRDLNIDLQTRNAAWQILERIPARENAVEHQSYWRACALYVAGSGSMQRMLHGGDGRGAAFSLVALLRACDIRLVDFFEPLKSFVAFLQLGAQYEEQLRALEKHFVVSAILFQKFETCFAHLLRAGDASAPSETERRRLFSFGWDLFLVVKSKLLVPPFDLIDAFHVLLCVVDVLLVHAPDRLRAVSLDRIAHVVAELSAAASASDGDAVVEPPAAPTLAYLCLHYHAPYADVRHVQVHLVEPLLAALRDGILRHQPARLPPHSVLSSAFFMGGLLDAFLAENAAAVQREYQLTQAVGVGVSFDERLFVDRPEQLGSPTRVSAPTSYYYSSASSLALAAGARGGGARPMTASPHRATQSLVAMQPQPPPTPISATQTTIQWLNRTVAGVADDAGAPASLVALLASAGLANSGAALAGVHARVSRLVDEFELHPRSRSVFVRKLFYRLLEAVLRAELERLAGLGRVGDVANLLQNDHFQRSLLACCVEIVVVAHKMPQTFPYSVRKLALVAVDMYKIVEPVLRCEPGMPSCVVRHLASVEESVLESAAWSSDSPIWQQVLDAPLSRDAVRALCARSFAAGSPGHAMFAGVASNLAVIEVDDAAAATMTTAAAALTASLSGSAAAPHSLLVFYRKVLQLVAMRAFSLTRNLNLPIDVFQEVWSALVHALTTPNLLRSLLRDRHVDQVIMCTIYGVCKVQSRPLTFRAIIDAYRRTIPGAPSAVYRDVRLRDGEHGNVIHFYNAVFIPTMERPLLDLHARLLALASANPVKAMAALATTAPTTTTTTSSLHDNNDDNEHDVNVDEDDRSTVSPRALAGGGAKLLLSPLLPQSKVIMSPYRGDAAGGVAREGVSLSLGSTSHNADGLREINESISPRVRRAPKRLFEAI